MVAAWFLSVSLSACTIEAKVPPPVVTVYCLELVANGSPVALDCAKTDAGPRDAAGE